MQKSSVPRIEKAVVAVWHRQMAHVSKSTIQQHLERAAYDIEVHKCDDTAPREKDGAKCDVCEVSKSKGIVSRRQIRASKQPFEVIHADVIDINPDAYNGDKWAFHTICDFTNFHFYMTSKKYGRPRERHNRA